MVGNRERFQGQTYSCLFSPDGALSAKVLDITEMQIEFRTQCHHRDSAFSMNLHSRIHLQINVTRFDITKKTCGAFRYSPKCPSPSRHP